jgi:peptidoglycan hydrolase-like protein with peptidoglycan-binding domain
VTREEVREIQIKMRSLGFDPGSIDGIWGPKTRLAYEHYIASRPREMTVMIPEAAKPWWESKALISSISTVAIGIGTIAAVVGTGGIAAIATPEAIGAIGAVVAGAGGIYGTVTRTQPIDPTLVAPGHRL